MDVVLGKDGCGITYQAEFKDKVKCSCGGIADIAFVAHEQDCGPNDRLVMDIRCCEHCAGEGMWLHDACCVAVYFCRKCLEPIAKFNQA